ncbi:uncharacterized protein LOC125208561 [Salvia hispanica]|uniref:uncharacterized protein LOC125208561 n=1 Tax=Salvia hispanica TaxID=49212 RepID=UPI002009CE4C|nr:uncharacterized protein LOC125208561 [Salvia hispanica]
MHGDNPLHAAAVMGNYEAAEMLVTRYPDLLYHSDCVDRFPHHLAACCGHKNILQLLISKTNHNHLNNPFAGDAGCDLLDLMICADFFDIALELVHKYPYMVRMNPEAISTVLVKIAEKATTFCVDDQFSFWKRLIYWCILKMNMKPKSFDIENQTILDTEHPWWRKLVLKLHSAFGINKIMLREKALELVKCLCKHMKSLDYDTASEICRKTILAAAKTGNRDVVEEIVEVYPLAIYFTDSSGQSVIRLAVKNCCEKVFNLLYQSRPYDYSNETDNSGNSILHLAARLAPTHKLNLVSGAALQMQRELQWFREAAITVPGGNKQDSPYPIHNSTAFTVFAVSDAVSLFTSTTSLLMFLSIHTSRYAEEDFLNALPKRLCIGLFTLFVSILFMMIAFSATVYLVFGRKKSWVLLPVGALSCLPISSFVLLQYPLLRDVISSTYGHGIFGKQKDRPFP